MIPDSEVPWWAVSLLDLDEETIDWYARWLRQTGRNIQAQKWRYPAEELQVAWDKVSEDAVMLAGSATALECAASEREACAKAALTSPRAFVQFCNIQDDNLQTFHLKDFHVKALRYMRTKPLAAILLPFRHGKSALSTVVLPLLDWAEEVEATQVRIYQTYEDFAPVATIKVMDIVENNQDIHRLYPWIRKPEKGDKCEKMWSTKGFSIGGKKAVQFSWRAIAVGAKRVGIRGDRVICDDWVTEGNAASRAVQDKMSNYLSTSAKTIREVRPWTSEYGTKWGTLALVGTVYDNQDVNARSFREFREKKHDNPDYAVMKEKIYPDRRAREEGRVLWEEVFPLEAVKKLEQELGRRAFQLRCMNTPIISSEVVFREDDVRYAVSQEFVFGQAPKISEPVFDAFRDDRAPTVGQYSFAGMKVFIGFDPGKGVKTRDSANPAAVVLGFLPDHSVHFIEWGRWSVPQPQQIRSLIELSRKYGCPVVIETNTLQKSYQDWINETAPDVKVIAHQTGGVVHDKDDGVESWQPLFENHKVVIHAQGAPEDVLSALLEEFMDWPQGRYKDLVMASWIARFQFREMYKNNIAQTGPVRAPSYVRARGSLYNVVDLRKYR